MEKMFKVFYSWESDLPSSKNCAFIRDCINKAIDLAKNAESVEAERDEATKDLTGSQDIVLSIFNKIDNCDLFVADVSLCFENKEKGKKSPNPNVLIELGYAVRVLGWERIICVFNLTYGIPNDLPFDIQHNRLLKYSFDSKSINEVKLMVAQSIFRDIRDLRNKAPLIKEGVPLHVIGCHDSKENKICQCLLPVDLQSRVDIGKISELKASAKRLYEAINQLTERMNLAKGVQTGLVKPEDENGNSNLPAFQKAYDFATMQHLLDSISSINNPLMSDAEPVMAFRPDLVKHWLSILLDVDPPEEFFSFGSLSKSEINLGLAGKNVTYYGSGYEKEKHKAYGELYRTLYFLWLRVMFPKTFEDYLFFPIVLQNISHTKDNDIRIVFSISKGEAIYPIKELIKKELKDDRGMICHEGLVDELFSVPQIPLIEQEFDQNQIPQPRFHMGPWGREQDTENEVDYENRLQRYILVPESHMHYSTTVSCLRAGESRWLSGGMLIKPIDGEVIINYHIHSSSLTGEMQGTLSYSKNKGNR